MTAYTIDQLTSEITTDSAALGYAPLVTVGDAGAIAALLNSKTTNRTRVGPTPLTVNSVLGALPSAAQAALWTNPNTATIRDDVRAQDREAVGTWALVGEAAGVLTADNVATVNALLAATSAQPASRAEELYGFGVVVTADDVALALRTV